MQKQPITLPERNPLTHAAHRRQVFWQVTFPLILGILLLAAAMGGVIWAAAAPVPEFTRWASVSLIWVLLPALGGALLLLVILTGLAYLVSKLIGGLPPYASLVQSYFSLAQAKVHRLNHALAEPAIKTKSWFAVLKRIRQVLTEPLDTQPKA